jgi:hypothetical protein
VTEDRSKKKPRRPKAHPWQQMSEKEEEETQERLKRFTDRR